MILIVAPGSGGRRYFTDIEYTPTGRDMGDDGGIDTQGIAAARKHVKINRLMTYYAVI